LVCQSPQVTDSGEHISRSAKKRYCHQSCCSERDFIRMNPLRKQAHSP
jgi:hypothetical protein